MGCWNDTCFVTNLPVFAGDPVEVLFLRYSPVGDNNYCDPNDNWTPYKFTFSGEYDDYGGVENCKGVALPLLVEAIQENLVEMPAMMTEYGNLEIYSSVKAEGLTIGKILDYESDGRLKVYEYEDSRSKLAQRLDDTRTCTLKHVVIHKKVYDMIANKFEFELPASFDIGKPIYDEDYAPKSVFIRDIMDLYRPFVEDRESRAATYVSDLIIQRFGTNAPYFPRLNRIVEAAKENDRLDYLKSLGEGYFGDILRQDKKVFENAVKMFIFNTFMINGRRSYSIPSGAGSQNDSTSAQSMVADMIKYQITQREAVVKSWNEK
jgi:hypothetical protein